MKCVQHCKNISKQEAELFEKCYHSESRKTRSSNKEKYWNIKWESCYIIITWKLYVHKKSPGLAFFMDRVSIDQIHGYWNEIDESILHVFLEYVVWIT